MATSSGWGARPTKTQTRDLICPICLDQLTIPRSLSCMHTFCTKCLSSHITNTVKKKYGIYTFHCPVCCSVISQIFGETPLTAWVEQFSYDVILASLLPGDKSIADTKCEPCSVQGKQLKAKYFCVVCKEASCQSCHEYHKSSKMLKDHQILTLEQFLSDPAKAVKVADTLTCTDHGNKEFEFFCSDHGKVLCATCLVEGHKGCKNCREITIHAKELIKEQRSNKVLNNMKGLEKHLMEVSKRKSQNMLDVDVDIKKHLSEISTMRQKVNAIFDKLERRVSEEGKTILKEQSIRKLDEDIQIQSLIAAIKNSCKQLEAISKYGSETQMCVVLHKMEDQLLAYQTKTVGYSEILKHDIHLNIPDCIREVSMMPVTDIPRCTVLETRQTIPSPYDITQSHAKGKATRDIVKIHEFKVRRLKNGNPPCYMGVLCLPDDKTVFWDMKNSRCCLYDSCYKYLSEYELTSKPRRMSAVDRNEIAVSLPEEMKIHFLLIADTITSTRIISTPRWCTAIASLNNKDLVFSGYENERYHWGILTKNGHEKCCFDITKHSTTLDTSGTHLILNPLKTRVYISCYHKNVVYCFGLDGMKHFEYTNHDLKRPNGLAINKDETLFIVGVVSQNIHQLSQDGSILQIISSGIPKSPLVLCFKNSGEHFLLTSGDDSNQHTCFVYQLK